MTRTYELRSGARLIGHREANTAYQALLDHVRSLGCREEEVLRLGADALAWRGAVYKAVPASSDLPKRRRSR